MWDMILNELQELAVTVLVALLSLVAAYALTYIRRAREALDQRIEHELADKALERVAYLAEVAVLATEASAAKAIRQAIAEGKASRAELVALGRQVVEQVLTQLDDEARLALAAIVGDVRAYIEQLVEAALERFKATGVVSRVEDLAAPKSSSPSSAAAGPQSA